MTTTPIGNATSTTIPHIAQHGWFSRRRRAMSPQDRNATALEFHALALAVGHEHAGEVRSLLTAIPIEAGAAITQQLRLPRQAFFVLSGRLAITVDEHPVAVLGPGSFFGESDTTRLQRRNVPRVHPLGRVVLGVAGPIELPEIHRLVPDLPTFTTIAEVEPILPPATVPEAPRVEERDLDHDDVDDVMGLGLLERIAG
ncbi:hypothetical protein [Ilumatobacter nonamiensis]|uniref:hypothetical protein n=1 Tax=Ilumatobacter nonamiensis TaxID=467093 RepID=UPI0003492F69|nr:hypothetical protein [Ilumatobacter nonamiensis]